MDGAEAADEGAAFDGDDFAVGKKFLHGVEGDFVVCAGVDGKKNDVIGDVKIRVAGGGAPVKTFKAIRHGQFHNVERVAVLIRHAFEGFEVGLERLVIRVFFIGFDDGDNGGGVDEARDVVNVSVGVVTLDAFADPENIGNAEEVF